MSDWVCGGQTRCVSLSLNRWSIHVHGRGLAGSDVKLIGSRLDWIG